MQPALEAQVLVALPMAGPSFLRGLLTNLSNPKSVIYFGSVLSLFVGDNIGTGTRWGLFLMSSPRPSLVQPSGDDFLAASDAPQLSAFSQMDLQAGGRIVYRFRFAPNLNPPTAVVLGFLDIVHSQRQRWVNVKNAVRCFAQRAAAEFWRLREEGEFRGVVNVPIRFMRIRSSHHRHVEVIGLAPRPNLPLGMRITSCWGQLVAQPANITKPLLLLQFREDRIVGNRSHQIFCKAMLDAGPLCAEEQP